MTTRTEQAQTLTTGSPARHRLAAGSAARRCLGVARLSRGAFHWSLTLCFLGLGLVLMLRHEMWRDELQSWMIGRDSSSLGSLVEAVRYERHPVVWYFLLFVLSRFTRLRLLPALRVRHHQPQLWARLPRGSRLLRPRIEKASALFHHGSSPRPHGLDERLRLVAELGAGFSHRHRRGALEPPAAQARTRRTAGPGH